MVYCSCTLLRCDEQKPNYFISPLHEFELQNGHLQTRIKCLLPSKNDQLMTETYVKCVKKGLVFGKEIVAPKITQKVLHFSFMVQTPSNILKKMSGSS